MAENLRLSVEFLQNGITVTNRATLQKSMNINASVVSNDIGLFIDRNLKNYEPGEVYDLDITITKKKAPVNKAI